MNRTVPSFKPGFDPLVAMDAGLVGLKTELPFFFGLVGEDLLCLDIRYEPSDRSPFAPFARDLDEDLLFAFSRADGFEAGGSLCAKRD